MSTLRISQSDQITELTKGLTLPLAPIGDDVLAIIIEAIANAWECLKQDYAHVLDQDGEAKISALLVSRLNGSLGEDGNPLRLFVSSVARGSETISFNGAKIEARPDLLFTLTKLDPRFQLMGECKIIDKKKRTPDLYRKNGITRFVDGDYAWASREGIMVAYVRCDAKLDKDLLSSLQKHHAMNCIAKTLCSDVKLPIKPDALGISTHGRKFAYVHTTSEKPGQIELWHLWLEV